MIQLRLSGHLARGTLPDALRANVIVVREVRPTIKALKMLERSAFEDPTPLDLVRRQDWKNVRLFGIQCPLLADARKRFAGGLPDQHRVATRRVKRPVYEVRDRDGAGWRGAVVLDADGDPWLVYAAKHNAFHRRVADYLASTDYLPSAAEYSLRAREEDDVARDVWRIGVVTDLLTAVATATRTGKPAVLHIIGPTDGDSADIGVELEHDEPSGTIDQTHLSSSWATITLHVITSGRQQFESVLLNACLPALQPDPTAYEAAYTQRGGLTILVPVTQAKLVQILSEPELSEPPRVAVAQAPEHLHYVDSAYHAEGLVTGKAVRGVCGVWFVTTRDESADLPVCPRCEQQLPVAQTVLDILRANQT